MVSLSQSIDEAIKSAADFSNMRILLVDLKGVTSDKYRVMLFPNIAEAIPDIDIEAGKTILQRFATKRDLYSLIINKRWLICKTGNEVKDVTIPMKTNAESTADKNDIIG